MERIENKLRTVRLALEILTGVCATLPDPEPQLPHGDADPSHDVQGMDISL